VPAIVSSIASPLLRGRLRSERSTFRQTFVAMV